MSRSACTRRRASPKSIETGANERSHLYLYLSLSLSLYARNKRARVIYALAVFATGFLSASSSLSPGSHRIPWRRLTRPPFKNLHTHTHQMVKEEEERRMLLEPRWPLASIIPFDYFDSRPFFFRAFTREDFFFFFPGRSPVRSHGLLFYFFFKKNPGDDIETKWNSRKGEKGEANNNGQWNPSQSKNVRSFARHNNRHGLAAADSADVIMSGENKKQNFPTHFFGTCFFFSVCCGSNNCLAISQKKKKKR